MRADRHVERKILRRLVGIHDDAEGAGNGDVGRVDSHGGDTVGSHTSIGNYELQLAVGDGQDTFEVHLQVSYFDGQNVARIGR